MFHILAGDLDLGPSTFYFCRAISVLMNSKFSIEKILIGVGAVVIVAILVVMMDDSILTSIMGKKKKNSAPPIGYISHSVQDVRRRLIDDLSWSQVKDDEKVFEGDSVFTGDSSQAQVVLSQGSSLDIASNSLVVLTNLGGQMSLDVQYGTLTGQLTGGETLKLKIAGKETELKGGQNSQIKIRADGNIAVLKGQVTVGGQTLKQNETLNTKSGQRGYTVGAPTEIKHVAPTNATIAFLNPGQNLKFKWQAPDYENQFELQIAKDWKFNDVVWTSPKTIAREISVPGLLKSGPFYWRVKSVNLGTYTHPWRMGVAPNAPVTVIAPKKDEQIIIPKNLGSTAKVKFLWKDIIPSKAYRIELAQDKDFKNIVARSVVHKMGAISKHIPPGAYYWRVLPLHPDRETPPWTVSQFKLDALSSMKLPPPQLILGKTDSLELESSVKNTELFAKLELKDQKQVLKKFIRNPATFSWKPVEGADAYELEVARSFDTEFKRPVVRQEVTDTSYTWKQTVPGVFIWRVKAINAEDKPGEPAHPEKLVALVAPPKTITVNSVIDRVPSSDEMNKPLKAMSLNWQPVVYAENYEIQISTTPEFTSAQTIITDNPESKLTPSQIGESFFRIRPLNASKQPIGRYSAVQTLKYNRLLELEPPKIVRPLNNSSVVYVGQGRTDVVLSWDSVRGAVLYEYEVAKDPEFSQVIQKGEGSIRRVLVNSRLSSGKYYWRVKALGKDGIVSPWQDPSLFTISSQSSRAPASR